MPDNAFCFICLDPRKAKRRVIAASLAGLGPVVWRRFGPLSLRSWSETAAAAQAAESGARRSGGGGLGVRARRALYAMQYNGARALFVRQPGSVAVCWNGLNGSRLAFMQGARDAGVRRLFYELAPLPDRITVDPEGVNFANSLPREVGPYLAWQLESGLAPDAWRAAGRAIRQRLPKVQKASAGDLPPLSAPFLFAPLQTPGDSQLRLFGGAFRTVEDFVDALGRAATFLPKGWHLRVKEHPTAPTSCAERILALRALGVVLDNDTDTFDQVAASRGIVTVNSSVGLEAMFYDKPVLAAGRCFWAIKGVADTVPDDAALAVAFSRADMLGFDRDARDAFLNFLTGVYYPAADGTAAPLIADRLKGVDRFGFWRETAA